MRPNHWDKDLPDGTSAEGLIGAEGPRLKKARRNDNNP